MFHFLAQEVGRTTAIVPVDFSGRRPATSPLPLGAPLRRGNLHVAEAGFSAGEQDMLFKDSSLIPERGFIGSW